MRKIKTFDDFFEVYDNDILTLRLPLTTSEYSTVELHLSSLEPPADVVVPGNVPQEVTMRQAKLALLHAGILDTVDGLIASMPGVQGRAARIEWEYASVILRDSSLVKSFIPTLGLTEQQIDNLFILAHSFG